MYVVVENLIKEIWGDADRVSFLFESEGGSSEEDEEADVREGVRDELGGGTLQRVSNLQITISITDRLVYRTMSLESSLRGRS